MANIETSKVGRRGAVIIPASLRRRFGIREGSVVTAEETPEGILLRPAGFPEVEMYTPERIAEFLLTNSIDAHGYAEAAEEVRKMGLDPNKIRHLKPSDA